MDFGLKKGLKFLLLVEAWRECGAVFYTAPVSVPRIAGYGRGRLSDASLTERFGPEKPGYLMTTEAG
jgi:hypothetical protein